MMLTAHKFKLDAPPRPGQELNLKKNSQFEFFLKFGLPIELEAAHLALISFHGESN
jgi:hypothetical protein